MDFKFEGFRVWRLAFRDLGSGGKGSGFQVVGLREGYKDDPLVTHCQVRVAAASRG